MARGYTTRAGGRSRGKLHRRRDCHHLPDDDGEVIDAPLSTFDDAQERCGACW